MFGSPPGGAQAARFLAFKRSKFALLPQPWHFKRLNLWMNPSKGPSRRVAEIRDGTAPRWPGLRERENTNRFGTTAYHRAGRGLVALADLFRLEPPGRLGDALLGGDETHLP